MMITVDDVRAAAARVRGRVLRTPLRRSSWLSDATGGDVFLKIETIQPTFSYKLRGAFNALLKVAERGDGQRVVTASAGNHGRAMAHAAAEIGLPLIVYAPAGAPRTKLDAIRALGAQLRLCRDYDDAERQAKQHGASGDALYISPYAHFDVMAGAGTIALEILEDLPETQLIVASIGGGGLVSGLAIASDSRAEVAGVEVEASTPFTTGFRAGRIVRIEVSDTLADGLGGNLDPDTPTFDIIRSHVKRIAVVSEDELVAAIRTAAADERLILEGAAAAAFAAVAAGKLSTHAVPTVIVVSGANIDLSRWSRIVSPAS